MPIYQYQCPKCADDREVLQRMNAPPPSCARCIEPVEMVKRPKAAAFVLRGQGWYQSDYKSK